MRRAAKSSGGLVRGWGWGKNSRKVGSRVGYFQVRAGLVQRGGLGGSSGGSGLGSGARWEVWIGLGVWGFGGLGEVGRFLGGSEVGAPAPCKARERERDVDRYIKYIECVYIYIYIIWLCGNR